MIETKQLEPKERELFVFWQFNGDNRCYCNLKCPECYGKNDRTYQHYWNGNVVEWEKAFERLNCPIYFVFSYGEALVSHGFYECVDMIGRHPNWTLNIITNLMANPERLLQTRLAKDKRLFVVACWHPEGVDDRFKGWETFKRHLLMLREAGVPVHVQMVWFPPVIKHFPEYFEWLDSHDFRVGVRRFVEPTIKQRHLRKVLGYVFPRWFAGKYRLIDYSVAEKGYLYAYTCPKVTAYGLNLESSFGKLCSAGKDLILVKSDGRVALCADCYGKKFEFGNIFDPDFKLKTGLTRCPTNSCGGDYGMPHLVDERFGALPEHLWRDTFVSQVENLPQSSPVAYPNRAEMLEWLEVIKNEHR
jgi:MoaA/NifB/PqqE/SkfB family radical SAM enzyme